MERFICGFVGVLGFFFVGNGLYYLVIIYKVSVLQGKCVRIFIIPQ